MYCSVCFARTSTIALERKQAPRREQRGKCSYIQATMVNGLAPKAPPPAAKEGGGPAKKSKRADAFATTMKSVGLLDRRFSTAAKTVPSSWQQWQRRRRCKPDGQERLETNKGEALKGTRTTASRDRRCSTGGRSSLFPSSTCRTIVRKQSLC